MLTLYIDNMIIYFKQMHIHMFIYSRCIWHSIVQCHVSMTVKKKSSCCFNHLKWLDQVCGFFSDLKNTKNISANTVDRLCIIHIQLYTCMIHICMHMYASASCYLLHQGNLILVDAICKAFLQLCYHPIRLSCRPQSPSPAKCKPLKNRFKSWLRY